MKKIPAKVKEIQEYKASMEPGSKSISFSQLSLYVSCPNRWYRAYVLNEAPYTPSIHTTFGTAFHETLQAWLDLLYNNSVKAAELFDMDAYLLERMRTVYVADKKNLGKDYSTSEELSSFYDDGKAILHFIKKHRKTYFDTKDVYLVGCEIPILYKLQDKFYFKGFIDCLLYDDSSKTWKILDFKTSTSGWNVETKKDFLKTSQILLYKEFLSKQFNIDPDSITVEYFIVKRKVNEDAEFPAMRKRVQEFLPSQGSRSVKKAVNLVESFIGGAVQENVGKYQEREYETTPSEHACKWCLFRETCKSAAV